MTPYFVEIANRQRMLDIAPEEIRRVANFLLADERVELATLSVAFVDDAEIHRINREFLEHDFPTDVISFLLDASSAESSADERPAVGQTRRGTGLHLEGEIVVSTETAIREAAQHHWPAFSEAVLYVVHGLLHLCGYDDLSDAERVVIRRRELETLVACGYGVPPWRVKDSDEERLTSGFNPQPNC